MTTQHVIECIREALDNCETCVAENARNAAERAKAKDPKPTREEDAAAKAPASDEAGDTDNPNTVSKAGCYVWVCECEIGALEIGYLITDDGNCGIDRPIAFYEASGVNGTLEADSKDAIGIAWKLADEPGRVGLCNCIDLRGLNHPDASKPMPLFIYGLRCWRIDRAGNRVSDEDDSPMPFSRQLLRQLLNMKEQATWLRSSAD